MSNLFELLPHCKVEFSLLEIEDFVTQVTCQGWYQGVESAVKCLNNAEPTVVRMDGPQELNSEVLPTDSIYGLKIDPFIVTSYRASNPNWCSVITFSEPEYWLVGNNVLALLNAVVDEMEQQVNLPSRYLTVKIDNLRYSASSASFQLSVTFEGNELNIPYFIERLSKYRSRMKASGLEECFDPMPYNWEHFIESFCRSLPNHLALRSALEPISSDV